MKFNKFVKTIQEYESDTFSAQRTKITKEEATEIAENILEALIDAYMDGGMITQHLMDIRDVDDEYDLFIENQEGQE